MVEYLVDFIIESKISKKIKNEVIIKLSDKCEFERYRIAKSFLNCETKNDQIKFIKSLLFLT